MPEDAPGLAADVTACSVHPHSSTHPALLTELDLRAQFTGGRPEHAFEELLRRHIAALGARDGAMEAALLAALQALKQRAPPQAFTKAYTCAAPLSIRTGLLQTCHGVCPAQRIVGAR